MQQYLCQSRHCCCPLANNTEYINRGTVWASLSASWHTRLCSQEAAFFQMLETLLFSGLRCDSMALSHAWLDLSGGRFQCDGGLWIAAAAAAWWWWWSSFISSTACNVQPTNVKRRSVTAGKLTLPSFQHLLYDECTRCSGSCADPVYQMHLSGHISTLLWPTFHIHRHDHV